MTSQPKQYIRAPRSSDKKILSRSAVIERCRTLRQTGQRVVFTNGCYDVLHAGHVTFVAAARALGDQLIVALNSDASIRRLKGPKRPINTQADRTLVMAALEHVDYVTIFDEDEPAALIGDLLPDVLVKGSDWGHYVSGRECVEQHGGQVVLLPLAAGKSSTATIARMAAADPAFGPTGDAS